MQHDKKSKKNNTGKLRMLLDNNSKKDFHNKDEKYLKSLSKRLKSSQETIVHVKRASIDEGEKEIDSLKPKVVIHARERKLEVTVELTKTEELPEFEDEKKGVSLEDEDVFEVEKVEVTGPPFVQVKPKDIIKEKEEEKVEKKAEADEDLLEWVPVEPEELAEFKVVEEKVEPKEEVVPVVEEKPVSKEVFCTECGAKLKETSKFCTKCGQKVGEAEVKEEKKAKVKDEEIPSFIAVKEPEIKEENADKKTVANEGLLEWEPVEAEELAEKTLEEEPAPVEEPGIKDEVKIKAFKDIESIDDKTAVLLYDNGYTSVDALAIASAKDLAKIKGVKKKQAKKIKKEVEGTQEWEPLDVEEKVDNHGKVEPIVLGESAEGELTEEQIEAEEDIIEDEVKIEAFKDMESIDDKVAIILYDGGFISVDLLKEATVKELAKVKGIKRKVAKNIRKELDEKLEESVNVKPIDTKGTGEGEVTEEQVKNEVVEKKEKNNPAPVELSKESEWEPVEETVEEVEKQVEEEPSPVEEPGIGDEVKIEALKDIESIDDKTAVLLYDNGFTSKDLLKEATVKNIAKVKGIKRKQAKNIRKELDEKLEEQKEIITEEEDLGEYFVEEEKEKEAKELDDKIIEYTEPPEPVEEELFEEETVEDVPPIKEDEVEDDVFKDISSIDQKTAKLLVENDITSIEILKDKTIKELTKIKGIRKKLAKQIKKEMEELSEEADSSKDESFDREDNPYIQEETDDEWESFDGDKISDEDIEEIKGYRHGDYTLFEKEIETKSKKKRVVRFFSKGEPEGSHPIELPDGYDVKENKKTGLPFLKKK